MQLFVGIQRVKVSGADGTARFVEQDASFAQADDPREMRQCQIHRMQAGVPADAARGGGLAEDLQAMPGEHWVDGG